MLFYYRTGDLWTQIEADSFSQGDKYGWYQNVVWNSGLSEQLPQGDTNPESRYQTGDRCGNLNNGSLDGIFYFNQFGFTSCARVGTGNRQILVSISWVFIRCSIDFIKNGRVIKTIVGEDGCPEVAEDPRNPGCEECCGSLLSTVRALTI